MGTIKCFLAVILFLFLVLFLIRVGTHGRFFGQLPQREPRHSIVQILPSLSASSLSSKQGVLGAAMPPVIIVGGGISGLILAYELTKAKIPFELFESQGHLGGRIATVRYPEGDSSEGPLEEYWQRSPVVTLIKELDIETRAESSHSSVIIDGQVILGKGDGNLSEYTRHMFSSPDEQAAFVRWNEQTWKLYEEIKKYCLDQHSSLSSTYVPPPPHLQELMRITFADFVLRQRLPRKVSEWIRIHLEPEIATEWDTISALDGIDEMRIFLNSPEGFGETSYHMKKGNTELIKQLVARLPPKRLHLNCTVTGVDTTGSYPIVTYLESRPVDVRQMVHLKGSHVAITIPVTEVNHIRFNPPLDGNRRTALETCRIGSYIKVHLRFQRAAEELWSKQYGEELFTLLTDNVIGAIYQVDTNETKSFAGAPGNLAGGYAVAEGVKLENLTPPPLRLTVLIHGKVAKTMSQLTDWEIEKIVTTRIESLFPGILKYLQDVEVFSFPRAVAHWPIKLGRSRFDQLAHHLRAPFWCGASVVGDTQFTGKVFIGGDMTYGSHSESAALSALAIAQDIKSFK